jgi:quercetin 2,3-dioxygenase
VRVRVRRGDERFRGRGDGVESRYAFSFAEHYDPGNIRFGPLLAVNEERLAPGAGFAAHRHRDVEIVTWVLDGELEHRGGGVASSRVRPGDLQRLSAGKGVEHEERNAPGATMPVRFLQMWLEPDEFAGAPHYTLRESVLGPGAPLTAVASGTDRHPGAVPLRNRTATLHVGRLDAGRSVALPPAAMLYAHVTRGALALAGEHLSATDAASITAPGPLEAAAPAQPTEFLLWELTAPPP